ncbi:NAD(P)/FAD-dependent oxidoreductase [Streptomyces sp. NBC_01451]|uniref:NAD(P)/FAD-dependent oxidoreductase n=1 Tax=Streptomyces sp. NBC_01451 TaxID=2903872 RepID=UPI002E3201E2|nr:FAD-dependent oxidoreductase [Streptomyces sp. NBC_01451]
MYPPNHVLVVGACAAGLATAEALRRHGYRGRLTVLGEEPHLPYDRPPLSKQVLSGSWFPDRIQLRPESALKALEAEFILGDPATALEPDTRTVHTASGRLLRADAVVVATGALPRRLPGQDGLTGVHVLRTLNDALALRASLRASSRLVVVGEGVLGCEIAATARTLGVAVTLVGPLSAPMAGQVGPVVAGLLADLHTEHGVHLRLGSGVAELTSRDGRVTGIRLVTGDVLPADTVVVAIGAAPATNWLDGSGLTLNDGLVCDSHCRAADGVYAVGDVARWHHDRLGTTMRLENRTNATEQAGVVAQNILGADVPYRPVPYFWTDQYDARLQVHGVPSADAEVDVVEGDFGHRRFVAHYLRGGTVTGLLGWNMPKQTRLRRLDVTHALIEAISPGRSDDVALTHTDTTAPTRASRRLPAHLQDRLPGAPSVPAPGLP